MRVTSVPFSTGTEGDAWMSCWCAYCAHDHDQHDGSAENNAGGCRIILDSILAEHDEFDAGEAWVAEPDDGDHYLPSRMICTLFQPCTKDECCGDPGASERAERVTEVMAYWRGRR